MDASRRNYMKKMIKALAAGSAMRGAGEMHMNDETSMREFMGKNSAQYVLNPRHHLDPPATEDINITDFAADFTHEPDEMNGMYDVVRDVSRTVDAQSGDCVDFSAVAASWSLQHTNNRPKIVVYAPTKSNPGHMNVYSGGQIYDYNGTHNMNPRQFSEAVDGLKVAYITDPI